MRYLFPTIVIYLFIKGFNVQCLITKAVIMTGEIRNTNERYHNEHIILHAVSTL